jgi:beta-glucosidase
LADARKYGGYLGVATNMEKSISLLAGIKEVAGKAAKVLRERSNLDYDAAFEESNHVWQNLAS